MSFSAPAYRQSANAPGGNAIIPVVRTGNPNSIVGVTVYTGGTGTAMPNVGYTPTTNFLIFNPGVMSQDFLVPMLNPSNVLSDQTVDLEMNNPSNTFIGSPSSAILTISAGPTVPECCRSHNPATAIRRRSSGQTNAIISITRTYGSISNVA